jgi:hypothetical protein
MEPDGNLGVSILLSAAANSVLQTLSLSSAFLFACRLSTAPCGSAVIFGLHTSTHSMNDSELFGTPAWNSSVQNFGSPSAHVQTHFKNQRNAVNNMDQMQNNLMPISLKKHKFVQNISK